MKKLITYGILMVLGLVLVGLLGVWLAFESQPRVVRGSELTPKDIARARAMLQDADPRRAAPGVVQNFSASPRDLDVLINDASQRLLHGSARVALSTGQADLQVSVFVPRSPVGQWLNVRARVVEKPQGLPALDSLRIGPLPVPAWLVGVLMHQVAAHYALDTDLRAGLSMVQRMALTSEGVVVSYRWQANFADRVRSTLVPADLQARLKTYSDRLGQVVAPSPGSPAGMAVPLQALLTPLADLARQRTLLFARLDNPPADAVQAFAAQENRALLITLALYSLGQPMARLVPAARDWAPITVRSVLIWGRDDHPRHFLISAVVGAEGGGRLADAIGVYKEVDDSQDGSGFSFDDLAADRAGTRTGQRAVHDPLGLQVRLAAIADESDFMPETADLPTFLNEREFRQRFGGVGEPGYQRVVADIEQRVNLLPILR